jgi:hypothetical protein
MHGNKGKPKSEKHKINISCRKCNFSKHNKTEKEYLEIIERGHKKE